MSAYIVPTEFPNEYRGISIFKVELKPFNGSSLFILLWLPSSKLQSRAKAAILQIVGQNVPSVLLYSRVGILVVSKKTAVIDGTIFREGLDV